VSFVWGSASKGDEAIRTIGEIVKDLISKDDKDEENDE